jgi:hypothetical protein
MADTIGRGGMNVTKAMGPAGAAVAGLMVRLLGRHRTVERGDDA